MAGNQVVLSAENKTNIVFRLILSYGAPCHISYERGLTEVFVATTVDLLLCFYHDLENCSILCTD